MNRLRWLLLFFGLTAFFGALLQTQNNQTFPQKQYYASDYGLWRILSQNPNTYLFSPPGVCTIPSPSIGSFVPFNTNAPVSIVDGSNSEIVTPTSAISTGSYCGMQTTTAYTHQQFFLTSGTGGLQEVLNQVAATIPYPVQVILDRNWYTLIHSLPGSPSVQSVIGAAHGNTAAILKDVTTAPETFYQWNGTQYQAVSVPSGTVSYNQGSNGAVTRTSTSKWQDTISIKDFGATGSGNAAVDSPALQNAVAAASATGKTVYIPAGIYLLNNASLPILVGAHNVILWGDGPASQLICQTVGGQDCIQSTGANGFGLMNLSVSFGPTATARTSGYAVNIETCTACILSNLNLNNGDLSGLRLGSSLHTSIHNLKVSNFFANGIFTLNNQDLRIDGLACQTNQDACLETSWYDSEYSAHSVPCEQITATNITSSNDLEGILVNSCRTVSISGFTITGSAKESILITQDPNTTTAHWPDRVAIGNGAIYGAGYGSNPLGNTTSAQAVYVNIGTNPSGPISHLSFANITATHISGWGYLMADFQNDDVQYSNLQTYDVGNGLSGGAGCFQTEGNNVNFTNVACSDVGTYTFFDHNTKHLTASNLYSYAANQVGSGTQALFLDSTATGTVAINGVNLVDTNVSTFTSAVFDDSTSGQHTINNIASSGTVSPTGPTSNNSGTAYTYADPTHSLVIRNGGTIFSFSPPNVYLSPTAGATSTVYANGAVFYYQSKCWTTSAQTESIGWYDWYPTLSTESFSLNQTGGCGFPITLDLTKATSVLEPQTTVTATLQAQHLSGIQSGAYASVPVWTPGTGAGTSPTVSANAQSSDASGYVSVTPGSSPSASATIVTATFGTAYSTLAKCTLSPANAAAAALTGTAAAYIPVASMSAFSIAVGSAALSASTLYTWEYTCIQ